MPRTSTADVPIPSIETDAKPNDEVQISTSSEDGFPTPSVPSSSLPTAPAGSSNDNIGADTSSPTRSARSRTNGITSEFQNMRLATPNGVENLNDLAEAVDNVARGADSRAASLTPGLSTPQQRRRARRSVSRVNQVPHDVNDEELPNDAFHSAEFQQAFRDAKKLTADMKMALGSSILHQNPDSIIHRLHKEADELARFQYPSTRTVGFVGDSGVGKSSLLNSLLDKPDLAGVTNVSGEACTCVVTEYHYHSHDSIKIEVKLFSMDEIREQLTALLQSYRNFHLHQGEGEEDAAEKRDMEESANLARDTFRSMFRGKLNDENMLINLEKEAVLETLMTWAGNSRPSEVVTMQSGLSLEACSATLMQLSSAPPSGREPATWPYISNIKVFLNARILSRGLVLVDLPGLRDLNSARRNITERYLLECHEIFVICDISRAVTDEGVQHVFELARQARLSNVGIVCTKSDDIRAKEAIRVWRGTKAGKVSRFMEAIAQDDQDEREKKEELSEYGNGEDLTEEEKGDQRELLVQLNVIQARKEKETFELMKYLITTRNSSITQALRASYKQPTGDGQIKVYCVSNILYWSKRKEPRSTSLPYLELSGILDLRRDCISIMAASQRHLARRYINHEIPALLAQVDLWVQSGVGTGSEERREAICRTLNEVEGRLRRSFGPNSPVIVRTAEGYRQQFKDEIYGSRRVYAWTGHASDAAKEWSRWHHATYSAFCRNYGNHYTRKAGFHNWNEEAMGEMVEDLEEPWENFCSTLEERQELLSEIVGSQTEAAIESFAELGESFDACDPLVEALVTRQQLLQDAIEEVYEKFERKLDLLRVDALSGIRTSLMGKAMESSYRRCMDARGRGSHGLRIRIIEDALSDRELFKDLMREFKARLHGEANWFQRHVQSASASYFEAIQDTFDLVRSENAARESEQNPGFRDGVNETLQAGRGDIQRIQNIVNA